ncbi:bifunctional phosphopantothenoylcysteine decarboxylase/phosphopantothenate--cysteine ligase CoaBC [Bacteroidota bacterium]|nr:bifunctional phosphopantothenoylcysteine decarboxylase/phosphopantothenate--cysteine ligase CoaBC [Bacteroidota bacterium]
MLALGGKKILLGISGSIAAYKAPLLVRLLIKNGAEVKVVLTPSALDFVTPTTLSTLSKNPVNSSFTEVKENQDNPEWNNHVKLSLWADYMIIAPATSNTISSMASARCDNLLLACYLSAKCRVFIAPSMDLDMYNHPANQQNLSQLKTYGNIILESETGDLASGLKGKGRMMEPKNIIKCLISNLNHELSLKGKNILITGGPTYEKIDPVRFIGNFSSGKMGFCLAEAAANLGANVTYISGPTSFKISNHSINLINVVTANEMYNEILKFFFSTDIFISAAAVADFIPKFNNSKIKKKQNLSKISYIENIDILNELGKIKTNQIIVGFALETDDGYENAYDKLINKNLDAIFLNILNDKNNVFNSDYNQGKYITRKKTVSFEQTTKLDLSFKIFEQIIKDI